MQEMEKIEGLYRTERTMQTTCPTRGSVIKTVAERYNVRIELELGSQQNRKQNYDMILAIVLFSRLVNEIT